MPYQTTVNTLCSASTLIMLPPCSKFLPIFTFSVRLGRKASSQVVENIFLRGKSRFAPNLRPSNWSKCPEKRGAINFDVLKSFALVLL